MGCAVAVFDQLSDSSLLLQRYWETLWISGRLDFSSNLCVDFSGGGLKLVALRGLRWGIRAAGKKGSNFVPNYS